MLNESIAHYGGGASSRPSLCSKARTFNMPSFNLLYFFINAICYSHLLENYLKGALYSPHMKLLQC